MSGWYNGLQAKVATENNLAAWIPCAGKQVVWKLDFFLSFFEKLIVIYLNTSCNVTFRKLLSAHKRHVRETGAILNPVRNSQPSRFISVPGQNTVRSSRGDSVVLQLQSVMMADVSWCRSRTGIGYLKESDHRAMYDARCGRPQRGRGRPNADTCGQGRG